MKTAQPSKAVGFLLLFATLSLAAVALGCFVASASGVPVGVWARNPAAWGVGAVTAASLAKWSSDRTIGGFLLAAPVGLIAALLSAGQHGVHRWVDLGPAHMNVAAVLLPPAVVAGAALAERRGPWPWICAGAALALLIAQPDASQATAYGGALLVIIAFAPGNGLLRGGGLALTAAAVVATWLRPDPLAPVPEVEGVMELAWRLSPFVAFHAWVALAGAALTPIAIGRSPDPAMRTAGIALAAYGLLSVLAPRLGAFPVPLVGMGMSPIIGLWLGVGLLAVLLRRPTP